MSIVRTVSLASLLALFATFASAGTMSVRWEPVTGASGYRVYWGSAPGQYNNQATITSTSTTLAVPDATMWYVGVKAYNASGESSTFSNEVVGMARPTVTSVTPNRGTVGQRLIVTIGGTNFRAGMTVSFLAPGITVNSATVTSSTTCTADITLSGSAAAGVGIQVVRVDRVYGVGNGLFTKDAAPSTAAPTLNSVRPLAAAIGVPVTVMASVRFSEAMARTSITQSTVHIVNDAGQYVPTATGYPSLSADGLLVTLKPAAPLLNDKVYRVQVLGGASGVKDAGGTAMVATFTQSPGFTTVSADATPPQVQYADPIYGTTGVSTLVQPIVYFSEPMLASSILPSTVRLLNVTGGVVPQAAGYPILSADGMTATLKFANPLPTGAQFRVQVVGGASGVQDRLGNYMTTDWSQSGNWTTGSGTVSADLAGPVVTGVEATPAGPTSVRLTWSTNELSTGGVLYRTGDGAEYLESEPLADLNLQHQVTVAGLLPDTHYAFYVRSVDRAGNPSTSTPDLEAVTDGNGYDYLTLEAESGDLVGGLVQAGGEGASGSAWIELPAGSAVGAEPSATARYTVTVPRVAAWYVWLRVRTTPGQAGWAASANGGAWEVLQPGRAGWTWVRLELGKIGAGVHQIDVGALAPGSRLDSLVLTQDPTFGLGAQGTSTPVPGRRRRTARQEDERAVR